MSINMADVKQIMYGNKEVTKIEDGLGNILWQKQATVDPYLIYIGNSNYYKFDMVNKVATQMTVTGGFSTAVGSKVFAWKPDAGYLSWWSGSIVKDLAIDLDNNTLTFTNHPGAGAGWPTDSAYDTNHAYSVPSTAGLGEYARIARNTTSIPTSFIIISGTNFTNYGYLYLDGVLQADSFQIAGNTAIKIGNDMYIYKSDAADSSYPYLYKFIEHKYVPGVGYADYFETSTIPVNPLGNFSTTQNPWAFWTANGRLFWDQYGYHYEYNFNTGQWQSHTWSGYTGSFKGSRVFKWNNRIFMLGENGASNKIYELDLSTDTWSTYWTGLPKSMRGDYLIDIKGRIGAGVNCAPRLA